MKPIRIQRKRTKGWRKPPGVVDVTRTGKWGNPFPVARYGLDESLSMFRRWVNGDSVNEAGRNTRQYEFGSVIPANHAKIALHGKSVMCWCRLDQACHGDIWMEIANA